MTDYEHLDYFRNIKNLLSSFEKFSTNIPFYGYSIICLDNINSRKLAHKIKTRKVITYGYKNKKRGFELLRG